MTRRTTRAFGVLVALGVLALSSPSAAEDNPYSEPGTRLGDGFKVADGSRLAGTVFPEVTYLLRGSWGALLALDGNPVDVFNEYLKQATDAGFDARGRCDLVYDAPEGANLGGPTTTYDVTAEPPRPAGLRAIDCQGLGIVTRDEPPYENVSIQVVRSARGAPYQSYVRLAYEKRTSELAFSQEVDYGTSQVNPELRKGVPKKPKEPDFPQPGEPLVARQLGYPPLDVADDTELLLAPILGDCNNGYDAVLSVDGDPVEALRRYTDQVPDLIAKEKTTKFRGQEFGYLKHARDDSVIQLDVVAAVDNTDDANFMRISACND